MKEQLPTLMPPISPETAPFWEAAADGRLLIPVCGQCGHGIWYPRTICPQCHSLDVRWEVMSGRGTIYSFTIIRRGSGAYADAAPYVVAYVELDEGPRVLTNVVGFQSMEDLSIGMQVHAVFDQGPRTSALLRFAPAPTVTP